MKLSRLELKGRGKKCLIVETGSLCSFQCWKLSVFKDLGSCRGCKCLRDVSEVHCVVVQLVKWVLAEKIEKKIGKNITIDVES